MHTPQRVALAFGAAVLALLLFATVGFVSCTGGHFSLSGESWPESAQRTDVRELNIAAGQLLRAETPYGDIRVRTTSGTTGSMRAVVHTSGRTPEEARARLDRARIVVDANASGVSLYLDFKADPALDKTSPMPTVEFDIELPAGVALALESKSGNVSAEKGPFGPSHVSSSYGNVSIDQVQGDVTATSKSGSVGVSRVFGGALEATSGYGSVSIRDVEGTRVAAKSSSGDVSAERIKAKQLALESGYGAVSLRDIAVEGDVAATSKSGEVSAETLTAVRTQLSSNYGSILAKHVRGAITLETSSGNIAIEDTNGSLSAQTGYGSVEADGVFAGVSAASKSGNVSVRARIGSELTSAWAISSKYGNVDFEAPPDMRFDVSAKTGYGDIDLGYAIELAPGALDKKGREVSGKVNGGGSPLRIESNSGNVSIRPIKP